MALKKLTHFLTRDASLIAIECWYNGRVNYFKEYTGIDFPLSAFWYRNEAFEFYTDVEEFEYHLPKLLSKWIKNNHNKFMVIHTQMKTALNCFKISQELPYKSGKEIINQLERVNEYFTHGFIGVLITHHLPRYDEHFLKKGKDIFDKNLVKQVIKWREAEGNVFFNEGVETINFLIKKIAKINKWNFEDLKHLTLPELKECVANNLLPKKRITMRENSNYFYFNNKVIYENEIQSLLKKFGYELKKEFTQSNVTKIKGSIANKGKVKGKVKLIFNRKQLWKVKKNDILVAPMTSVWHLPAMKKSSGIVTDEWGITCHAAIISRELGKPCIIGTKIATKVFKDGDLVEVDANTGIVRKLK